MSQTWEYKNTGPVDCKVDFDTSNIKGKTAIVTGGASGLGLAYVRALLKAGAYVVIADLNEDAAKKIQQEFPDTAAAMRVDVTVWKDQLAAFKKALEISPNKRIDIVVANAGISTRDALSDHDLTKDEPEEPNLATLDVNINGVFLTSKLALWYFEKQNSGAEKHDGCLILKASMAGYVDLTSPQYAGSKFAVRGLMRALRREVGKSGIRVNVLAPWYIHTNIMGDGFANLIEKSGVGFATPDDAALAMLRIASDPKVQGRAFAIVPRNWKGASKGYIDLDQDDFEEGTWLEVAQRDVFKPMELGNPMNVNDANAT